MAPDAAPNAAAIFDRPSAPSPWPSARPILDVAKDVLPTVTDDLEADLIERLSHTVLNQREEISGLRQVVSVVLQQSGELRGKNRRRMQRMADMRRAGRVAK